MIEQLPDTEANISLNLPSVFDRANIYNHNKIYVKSKSGYVEDIAATLTTIPDVVKIYSFAVIEGWGVFNPLSPPYNCTSCPREGLLFVWEPYRDTTEYNLILARDADMTEVVKVVNTPFNAYQFDGKLDYNTTYYWRLKEIQPRLSDWSIPFSFRTEAAPPLPDESQPITWNPLLIALIMALAASLGLVAFLVVKRSKTK
jgi:hypothetical protein